MDRERPFEALGKKNAPTQMILWGEGEGMSGMYTMVAGSRTLKLNLSGA